MTLIIGIIWDNRSIPICWVVRQSPKGHFSEQIHVDLFTQFARTIKECNIAQAYKKRSIIETFFADMKSRGFNIMSTKVDYPDLLSHLLIVYVNDDLK